MFTAENPREGEISYSLNGKGKSIFHHGRHVHVPGPDYKGQQGIEPTRPWFDPNKNRRWLHLEPKKTEESGRTEERVPAEGAGGAKGV